MLKEGPDQGLCCPLTESMDTCTVNPRFDDSIVPKDVAIKMNSLLYRILNEQVDMLERYH